MSWFVYILKCRDQTLYTGITNDIQKRIEAHNLGKGAKYTRSRTPVSLVYSEKQKDKSAASIREHQVKNLTRAQKLALVFSQLR